MFKVILLPSVANPDPVGSEPFWSDPDPINCPVPVPDSIITSQKTRKKSKQLIIYMFFYLHFINITNKF